MIKTLSKYIFILLLITNYSFSQSTDNKWGVAEKFKKGNFSVGSYIAVGYNAISHVDGTLQLIPNNVSPTPLPGTPVYSSPLSINIQSPSLTLEYWVLDNLSVREEVGVNIMVLGSSHALSDFAYILVYMKMLSGVRYYFDDIFFLGSGMFFSFPLVKPLIGFISAETTGNVTFGPYIEIGANYALTKTISIEGGIRFSFSVMPYTNKDNAAILTTLNSAPLDLGLGLNYKVF